MSASPNPGDFEIYGNWETGGADISCPLCDTQLPIEYGWTIRNAIGTATAHIRTAHPLSAPTITIAP